MTLNTKIRVLVVDDSSVVRRAISDALSRDPGIEVVGNACDPYVARDMILELNPDVITLDIEMPRMDGITFLRILQKHRPMPVIIISSLTQAGSKAAMDALEAGAVDVIAKPSSAYAIGDLGSQLAHRVKGAAVARLRGETPAVRSDERHHSAAAATTRFNPRQIILLGASTGGTEAIKAVLTQLPNNLPGIAIVQHIPAVFSKAFADRLNDVCALRVKEAAPGDELKPGMALIAPGDYHMMLAWNGGGYRVVLNQAPPQHHTRPSVDVLFESAASAGRYAVAGILTGMGVDGAAGMKKLKVAGAATFAQNEETSVVYGMPRAAVELGVVDYVLPLNQIPTAIIRGAKARAEATGEPRAVSQPTPMTK